MHAPIIRQAVDPADRAAAFNLRYELYVAQQGLFGDVADHARRWLRDEGDEHATIWVAEVGGEIVATARVLWGGEGRFDHETRETFDVEAFTDVVRESEIAVASRMLVKPEHRQSPLLALVILSMMEEVVARGTELTLSECEPHLLNTWVRAGFRSYGLVEHPSNGTLVRIGLVCGDVEHLRALGSPLAPLAARRAAGGYAPRRLAVRLARSQHVVSEARDRDLFWSKVEETLPLDRFAGLLGGLTLPELDALLGNSHALDCAAGSVLIRKGHTSRTLYVLLTGSLEVWDAGRRVAEVGDAGAVLGEVAFFGGGLRMSDVKAGAHGARVLALSERNIKELISTQGAGAAKFLLRITEGLCRKLHDRAQ